MKRVVLSAHALHDGDSAALLRMLLPALYPHLVHAFVDARFVMDARRLAPGVALTAVAQTPLARIVALRALASLSEAGDRLFCFNNAPPLGRSRARTILYMCSAFLAPARPSARWSAGERAQLAFERLLLRLGNANVDEFWTATPHMARALAGIARGRPVRAMPFFDMPLPASAPSANPVQQRLFFCPTSRRASKNYMVLYRAWALLAEERLTPRLEVALQPDAHARLLREARLSKADAPEILNLGPIDHSQMKDRLAAADAVISPSVTEYLGISTLAATPLRKPILAPERSYVRDVCVPAPAQTFDPQNPYSIADAVRRFLGCARAPIVPLTPEGLVKAILA